MRNKYLQADSNRSNTLQQLFKNDGQGVKIEFDWFEHYYCGLAVVSRTRAVFEKRFQEAITQDDDDVSTHQTKALNSNLFNLLVLCEEP